MSDLQTSVTKARHTYNESLRSRTIIADKLECLDGHLLGSKVLLKERRAEAVAAIQGLNTFFEHIDQEYDDGKRPHFLDVNKTDILAPSSTRTSCTIP
jgi:hypothetical protein